MWIFDPTSIITNFAAHRVNQQAPKVDTLDAPILFSTFKRLIASISKLRCPCQRL